MSIYVVFITLFASTYEGHVLKRQKTRLNFFCSQKLDQNHLYSIKVKKKVIKVSMPEPKICKVLQNK